MGRGLAIFCNLVYNYNMELITKEQFLEEHNKLSPKNLQATLAMVTRFQEEKKPLLKDDGWCLDKIRIQFISWLIPLSAEEKKKGKTRSKKQVYKNYPETH
jgi:hypothetical protein